MTIGAVAAALRAPVRPREGEPQRGAVRARSRDVGAGEEARDRRLVRSRSGRLRLYSSSTHACVASLSTGERQVGDVLEHGEEPPLDLGPEVLLLPVLVGAVGQRRLVGDAEPGEPLRDLRRDHRRRRCRSWPPAAARASGSPATSRGRGSRRSRARYHCRWQATSRAVVEDAEQERRHPLAARREHLLASRGGSPSATGRSRTRPRSCAPRDRRGVPRRARPPRSGAT